MSEFADTISVEQLEADPYPVYARLRAEQPVAWVPAVQCWLVTRNSDVRFVTRQTEHFTAEAPQSPVDRYFGGRTLMTMNDPEHLELRRALDAKFRPKHVAAYIEDLVAPIVQRRLDELLARPERRSELVSEYFEPISALALAHVLGLGHLDSDRLQPWFHGLSQGATNFEDDPRKAAENDRVIADIRMELEPLMQAWQQQPDEDSVISSLLTHGCPAGTFRDIEYLMPSIHVILLGGMQEPGHGAASCLAGLLANPPQLAFLRENPGHWDDAIHEALRWMAPIGTMQVTAVHDVELAGSVIPRGDLVSAVVASACHDESLFEDPARFDIHRPRQGNAAFGYGPHMCAGHQFARDLERLCLHPLVQAMPDLTLEEPATFRGWEFRSPTALHVSW